MTKVSLSCIVVTVLFVCVFLLLKITAGIGVVLGTVVGLAWKIGLMDMRKKHYLDFYRNYDPKVDFERMKKAGVFQSVNPDGSAGDL